MTDTARIAQLEERIEALRDIIRAKDEAIDNAHRAFNAAARALAEAHRTIHALRAKNYAYNTPPSPATGD